MIALKRWVAGAALAAAVAVPMLTPAPADAWWRGGWHVGVGVGVHPGWGYGWHPGWGYGWRGGVYVGAPGVVVGAPAYPYAYPAYPYTYGGWRWAPGYWGAGHVWIGPRWVR